MGLLKEDERSVEWLLNQLRPESSLRDRLLLKSITGYEYSHDNQEVHYSEDGEENRDKEVSNFNFDEEKKRQDSQGSSVITPKGSFLLLDPIHPYST